MDCLNDGMDCLRPKQSKQFTIEPIRITGRQKSFFFSKLLAVMETGGNVFGFFSRR